MFKRQSGRVTFLSDFQFQFKPRKLFTVRPVRIVVTYANEFSAKRIVHDEGCDRMTSGPHAIVVFSRRLGTSLGERRNRPMFSLSVFCPTLKLSPVFGVPTPDLIAVVGPNPFISCVEGHDYRMVRGPDRQYPTRTLWQSRARQPRHKLTHDIVRALIESQLTPNSLTGNNLRHRIQLPAITSTAFQP